MEEVRQQMGSGPVYISFDIDGLDPAFAPGTGKRITRSFVGLQCPGLHSFGIAISLKWHLLGVKYS